MASPSFIKTMIEALRTKPNDYSTPEEVRPGVRRGMSGNVVQHAQHRAQYNRYVKVQQGAGETPVSYEEWMRK